MIYTDGTHLVGDSLEELHEFAQRVGLRREWFQDHPRHPHYDLTTWRMARKVIKAGVRLVSPKNLMKVSKEVRCGR